MQKINKIDTENIYFKMPGWEQRLNIEYIKTCPKKSAAEEMVLINETEKRKGLSEFIEYRNRIFCYNFDKKSIEYYGIKEEQSDIPLFSHSCSAILWVEHSDVGLYYRHLELEKLCDEYDYLETIQPLEDDIFEYNGYYFYYHYETSSIAFLGKEIISKENPIKTYTFSIDLWEDDSFKGLLYRNSFLDKIIEEFVS